MRTREAPAGHYATEEKPARTAHTDPNRGRIRSVAFWATTVAVVFELVAGSVWNLVPIEWVEIQLRHLGYPHYFSYVLGAWQVCAAVAIIAPALPLIGVPVRIVSPAANEG
jgi:hypothetical protein